MSTTKEQIAELQDAQGKKVTVKGVNKYSIKIAGQFKTEVRKVWKTSKARAITEGVNIIKLFDLKSGSITCKRLE